MMQLTFLFFRESNIFANILRLVNVINGEMDNLTERIFIGDQEAFKSLYENSFHTMLSVACKYVEREVAKDIVQDIFLKLWSHPKKYSSICDMRFYLYRSVQLQCLNYIRNKKVENNYRNNLELVSEDFFYNAVLEEELFVRLKNAIEELPEKYKNVIKLYLQGLSDKEIALQLGVSIDVVKTQKKRGKDMLRQRIEHPILLIFINLI